MSSTTLETRATADHAGLMGQLKPSTTGCALRMDFLTYSPLLIPQAAVDSSTVSRWVAMEAKLEHLGPGSKTQGWSLEATRGTTLSANLTPCPSVLIMSQDHCPIVQLSLRLTLPAVRNALAMLPSLTPVISTKLPQTTVLAVKRLSKQS